MKILRGLIKAILFLLWLLVFVFYSIILSFFMGEEAHVLMHRCWDVVIKILNIKVIYPKNFKLPKNAICVSNHSSYLDIFVLGKILNPVFIGKIEIKKWPIINLIGKRIVGMLFIDRRPSRVKKEKERLSREMRELKRPLLFFPEGKTTDGKQVASFRPALFEMILNNKKNKVIPIYLDYTHINGKKITTQNQRKNVAWYREEDGAMEVLLQHIWRVFSHREITVEVKIGPPISVEKYKDRRTLAKAAHLQVDSLKN